MFESNLGLSPYLQMQTLKKFINIFHLAIFSNFWSFGLKTFKIIFHVVGHKFNYRNFSTIVTFQLRFLLG